MTSPIAVFDLDGTLLDTAPDLLASLNHVLVANDLPETDIDRLRRFVGQGGRVMLERAFTAAGRTFSDEIADQLVQQFVAHYGDNMPGETVAFEGVLDLVDGLRARGYKTAICTNKTEALAVKLIASMGLSDKFDALCGGDTFPVKKPDADHIFLTIDAAGGDRNRAVMFGDSAADINAANNGAIPVIAVDFGYTDEHVSTFGPTRVISHFNEITLDDIDAMIGESHA
ncbi:MAG: HAD hydrolase-like protein [Ahrensia sp.]